MTGSMVYKKEESYGTNLFSAKEEDIFYYYEIFCYNKKSGIIYRDAKVKELGGISDFNKYKNKIIKEIILDNKDVEIDDIYIMLDLL